MDLPPLPPSVSDQMRTALELLAAAGSGAQPADTALARAGADAVQQQMAALQLKKYAVTVGEATIGGVPCRTFSPAKPARGHEERLLLNFHGGGFRVDSGSLSENIPIAALTGYRIESGLYRMAPEALYPAWVDDALALYQDALTRYHPSRIAIFGTSAGGILTAQLIAKIRKLGLPMPAAAGYFSITADFVNLGDSEQFFPIAPGVTVAGGLGMSLGGADPRDPLVSPIFDDLSGYPPSLSIAGTRDLLLSHTISFHLALMRAGTDARLAVFDALPHAHWAYIDAPESDAAFEIMARFLSEALA